MLLEPLRRRRFILGAICGIANRQGAVYDVALDCSPFLWLAAVFNLMRQFKSILAKTKG